jgi:putative membrane protein insertion efficiency factor
MFSKIAVYLFSALIKAYKLLISPILPSSCRFYPSCSEYALDALRKYGLVKGLWLTVKRIARCHPLSDGGYDPVR